MHHSCIIHALWSGGGSGCIRCISRWCTSLFFMMYTAERNSSVISVLLRVINGVSFICTL